MLIRLILLGAALTIALSGRCGSPKGEPGGELAMALYCSVLRQNVGWL